VTEKAFCVYFRYTSILHVRDKGNKPNPDRFKMILPDYIKQMHWKDGLNNVQYKVSSVVHTIFKTTIRSQSHICKVLLCHTRF